jgi:DMSO/TMAO reductase YedYZ molybdopterin-dependent catalytic subunit
MNIKRLYALVLLMSSLQWLHAQVGTAVVKISGEVTKPLQLTAADLSKMTHVTAALKDKDGKEHPYSGVPVVDILKQAGVTTGKQLRGAHLSKYVLVRCADGYEVLFSLAEMDTAFTDKVLILADAMEGKPLPGGKGPFRLIMPGEKVPARSCFQVTEFVIRYGRE